jgi:hypothetical protein
LPTSRRLVVLAAVSVLVVAGIGAAVAARSPWVRGYALYHGHLPLTGRIYGHETTLPPETIVCANCHEPGRPGADPRRLPQLDRRLAETRDRRGGPSSAYTEDSFCSLIANGIDPTSVLISRTMPRFELDRVDCAALWSYLSAR